MLRRISGVAALVTSLALSSRAGAHPLAPSLLDVREAAAGRVEVLWRTPALRAPGSDLRPVLPARCRVSGAPETALAGSAAEVRWVLDCGERTLVGETIAVRGIAASRADVLLRVGLADRRTLQTVLTPEAPAYVVPDREGRLAVARSYGALGVRHILGGFDHLLFVLGLVLLVAGRRLLVKTVTAFTLGHSITLSLAVLGFVEVPQAAAEAAIAASILVLATELAEPVRRESWIRCRPWAMAAAFGLLHGLGFAGALAEAGLPAGEIPLALASFNLGIEAGQLAFVAAVVAARALAARAPWRWPERAALVPAYAIGSAAAFWLFERSALALRSLYPS